MRAPDIRFFQFGVPIHHTRNQVTISPVHDRKKVVVERVDLSVELFVFSSEPRTTSEREVPKGLNFKIHRYQGIQIEIIEGKPIASSFLSLHVVLL